MSWLLYRWVWRLESPLSIGLPPAGSLNRCRLYVPARNIWGALTEAFAVQQATGLPEYAKVGEAIRKNTRLTYLYPAEENDRGWSAWLPRYENGRGLVWQREDDPKGTQAIAERDMRRRLLMARPGTAIDHDSETAADGTLRETECISEHWRDPTVNEAKPVAFVGYVFLREDTDLRQAIEKIGFLSAGGDTRYGLGRLRRRVWEAAFDVFGAQVDLDDPNPCVITERILAHAGMPNGSVLLKGDLEALMGWNYGKFYAIEGAPTYWRPGSVTGETSQRWSTQESGLWTVYSSLDSDNDDQGAGR